jgi:D-cysteine desulfhydrase family pyridoxal phosphate-dependent enzyme
VAFERLDDIPRQVLGETPTPLELLPRTSEALGRAVYIKRDDRLGPALGGNKTRKLEYLLAEALDQGQQRVVTYGGLQSNHARLTAVAAVNCGLEPHLFYFAARPRELRGNLLINELAGARMHFFPIGGRSAMSMTRANRMVKWLARLRVGSSYFIPVGGHSATGCLGYTRAARELDEQARALGIGTAHVVLAAGTGGTLAGLMVGLRLLGSRLRLMAIDVGSLWTDFPAAIAAVANQIAERLASRERFEPGEVPLIEGRYVGERYGVATPEGLEALRNLLQRDGVLLDPVYTAKAFAGLMDQARSGTFGEKEPILFLHTGGAPGLFGVDGIV